MFFAMMIMLFAAMRVLHGRRRPFAHAFFRHHHRHYRHWQRQLPVVAAAPAPRLSAFEQLRERYVNDDISVEQFEAELDVLMQTPEGRKQV